jgi:hypothetical protein
MAFDRTLVYGTAGGAAGEITVDCPHPGWHYRHDRDLWHLDRPPDVRFGSKADIAARLSD